MSSTNYKQLISYMPTMAAVVNSFQSPEVQLAAFKRLMGALDEVLDVRPEAEARPVRHPCAAARPSLSRNGNGSGDSDIEVVHDLVEGDSIHSAIGE